jgi:hypothetical protein
MVAQWRPAAMMLVRTNAFMLQEINMIINATALGKELTWQHYHKQQAVHLLPVARIMLQLSAVSLASHTAQLSLKCGVHAVDEIYDSYCWFWCMQLST